MFLSAYFRLLLPIHDINLCYLPSLVKAMNTIIDKALKSLNSANKIVELKNTLEMFLEGFKKYSLENSSLRNELKVKTQKITQLETQVKLLNDEKVEIAESIEFNATSIKKLQTCMSKASNDERAISNECKSLNERVNHMEELIDDDNAYSRRESLIFSGPAVLSEIGDNETCAPSVMKLLKTKLKIEINPNDISVSHRLGSKKNQGQDKRSIIAKFCRRDLKRDILASAKRVKPSDFFVNESLTNVRQKISQALRLAKKEHSDVISGITSIEGRVFVWRKGTEGSRDVRHCVNTLARLEDFCMRNLGQSSTNFLAKVGERRQERQEGN